VGLERPFVGHNRTTALILGAVRGVRAVCVDRWGPFLQRLRAHLPHARIVDDTFHVLRHVTAAVDETRRAACFRNGGQARGLLRGKRWLLLRRGAHLERDERRLVKARLALNRRLATASLLQEPLAHLWDSPYDGAARWFLMPWRRALRWPRVPAVQTGARVLLRHLDGLLASCHEQVPFGKGEATNGNSRAMLRRGRGYRDHDYLLLTVQRAPVTRRLQQAA